MVGLVPTIHDFFLTKEDVDARDKPEHDHRVNEIVRQNR
jgi:hypothetical protein